MSAGVELLIASSISPLYFATTEYVPGASDEMDRTAVPVPSKVPLPNKVGPDMNATVPAGSGPFALVTVAVKVTCEPTSTVVLLEVSVVVVGACCTTSLTVFDTPAALVASPEYFAERTCVPTARVVVEKVATPPALKFALPIAVVPS